MDTIKSLLRFIIKACVVLTVKAMLFAYLWQWLLAAAAQGSYLEAFCVFLIGVTLAITVLVWACLYLLSIFGRGLYNLLGILPGHRSSWLAALVAWVAVEASQRESRRNAQMLEPGRRQIRR